MIEKVCFDTNIFEWLLCIHEKRHKTLPNNAAKSKKDRHIQNYRALEKIGSLIKKKKLKIFTTAITIAEVTNWENENKKKKLLRMIKEMSVQTIPARGSITGSKVHLTNISFSSGPEPPEIYIKEKKLRNLKLENEDMYQLLAFDSAEYKVDVFVTWDFKSILMPFQDVLDKHSIPVMSPADLVRQLETS